MRRRVVFALLGCAAAWPLGVSGQQHPPMGVPAGGTHHPVIGFLYAVLGAEYGFRRGLSELGFFEGTNVAIDYRSSMGQLDRLSAMASDLAKRNVTVIICFDNDLATQAAMAATNSIPIVFTTGGDPVRLGLVASLSRPGANATGVTTFGQELLPKRLELVREALPTASKIALLVNPNSPTTSQVEVEHAQGAARSLGLEMVVVRARSAEEIEAALSTAAEQRADAILVASEPFLSSRQEYVAILARRFGLPSFSFDRTAVVAGQMLSYAPNVDDLYHLAGVYAGRILKGEKPAELPVLQPTKFALTVNLRTAKAIGLTIPPMLLARADEVIE